MNTAPKFNLYRINPRPVGDFVIQRRNGDRIQRWGRYDTRPEAELDLTLANAQARLEATPAR